jgi:hypothetical protein
MFEFKNIKPFLLPFLAAISLGLAPYHEPHLWGKIRWIAGGAKGMQFIDWFDFMMHASPWIWLFVIIFKQFVLKTNTRM